MDLILPREARLPKRRNRRPQEIPQRVNDWEKRALARGRLSTSSSTRKHTRFCYLSVSRTGERWIPDNVCSRFPSGVTHPGFRYKTSLRWRGHTFEENPKKYSLPYIDKVGRISISTQYFWKCKPSQLIATMISTVYGRLEKLMISRHKKRRFRLNTQILWLSAYYVLTRDDYVFNRALAITRASPGKARQRLKRLLCCKVNKLDDNTRFVYGQACKQASWLKSRGKQYPRDQSIRCSVEGTENVSQWPLDLCIDACDEKRCLRQAAYRATTWAYVPRPHSIVPEILVDSLGEFGLQFQDANSSDDESE